jgi:SPP1 gp7 family putative phage head morphogenesis protein
MAFEPPDRIEIEYRRLIAKLIGNFLPDDLTPASVLRAFANLAHNPDVLESLALPIAKRMVTQLKVDNARSWREAATKSSRGREIYEALQNEMGTNVGQRVRELVAENAKLISSIPETIRTDLNQEINRLQLEGKRPEAIAEFLRRRVPQITRAKAALVARTETGKASTALTRARSEDLDIKWYVWVSVKDQRVRPSHRLMHLVLVAWADPPNPETLDHEANNHGPYHAGNIYNCRCDALPITSLDLIAWPAKVYRYGSITRMTRGAFAVLSGMQKRAQPNPTVLSAKSTVCARAAASEDGLLDCPEWR